jgi:hypothetical protein
VLGTDYPFAAAEVPAGAVLRALGQEFAGAIGAGNARALMGRHVPV